LNPADWFNDRNSEHQNKICLNNDYPGLLECFGVRMIHFESTGYVEVWKAGQGTSVSAKGRTVVFRLIASNTLVEHLPDDLRRTIQQYLWTD
jgi:hypothetical protein